jgi:phosphatidylglycerophosphatase A
LLDKFGEPDEWVRAVTGIAIRGRMVVSAPRIRLGLPKRHPAILIATWFGIGLIPVAPGSCGSLAALALAWAIRSAAGIAGLALSWGIVLIAGCWAAGRVANASGLRDPGIIVVDEVAGQLLVLFAAPPNAVVWGLALLLFRLFDIWKPWPVRWADRHLKGGFGIMLDDLLAAGYALASLWAFVEVGRASDVLG